MGEEILAAEAARNDYAIAWSAGGNPAQLALLECPIFEVFFGGARGGGKTDGMLGEWVRHAEAGCRAKSNLLINCELCSRSLLTRTIRRASAKCGALLKSSPNVR